MEAYRKDAGLILNTPDVMRSIFCQGIFAAVLFVFQATLPGASDTTYHPEATWIFRTGGSVTAGPALSEDGETLYVGSSDRYFYAIKTEQDNPEAVFHWRVRLGGKITSAAVVDGTNIYVPCNDGRLYNLRDAGPIVKTNWVSNVSVGKALTSVVVGEDGTIYVGSADKKLYALEANGRKKTDTWPFDAGRSVQTPTLAEDTIYFAAGAKVIGVSESGSAVSTFYANHAVNSIPAIGEDGSIYFGANNERVHGVDSGGTTNDIRWRFNTGKNVQSSPVIGADGSIYIGADTARLYSFDQDGNRLWSVSTRRPVRSSLSIGADGTIFAGSDDRRMYAISSQGKIRWTYQTRGRVRSAAAIDSFGTVYFGSTDKNIYAIAEEDDITADENMWSMFRRDAQHTARSTDGRPFVVAQPYGDIVDQETFDEMVVDGQAKSDLAEGTTSIAGIRGQHVLISARARAGAAMSFQWQLNGADISLEDNRSATSTTLVLENIQATDAGNYTLSVATSTGDTTESEPFTLSVESPPVVTTSLAGQFFLASNNITLGAATAGTLPLSYQWYSNGVPVPGANTASFTITNGQPSDSGSYFVVISNSLGLATNGPAAVSIFPRPAAAPDTRLAAGHRHSLAILADRTLWSWGLNSFGQLGNARNGSTTGAQPFEDRPILVGTNGAGITNAVWRSVAAGGRGFDNSTNQPGGFSLGLQTNGTLWSWGDNSRGQLGLGSTVAPTIPTQIGTDNTWFQIAAGATHALAIKSDGSLWAWGANESGQLGNGTTTNSTSPARIGAESAWLEVQAGASFSLARRADGTLWAWGTNGFSQLGLGTTTRQLSPVQVGTDTDWARIAAGVFHAHGVKTNGTLWAWGRGNVGQLGLGGVTNSTRPAQIGSNGLWTSIQGGTFHSLAISNGGTLSAWGANTNGQLGRGSASEAARLVPTLVPAVLTGGEGNSSKHALGLADSENI